MLEENLGSGTILWKLRQAIDINSVIFKVLTIQNKVGTQFADTEIIYSKYAAQLNVDYL